HELRMMHADPHPGNFIIDEKNDLGAIDFGCIKHIPDDFYEAYFELASYDVLNNPERVNELFKELEIIRPTDSEKDVKIVTAMFTDLIKLLSRPFNEGVFDFSDDSYFAEIYMKGEAISKDPEMNRLQARGSRHFIYFNRTFFGLYNILHALKAKVDCSTIDFLKKAS
ncbi:MAG: AarF/UbiB family protein, partial [Ekhidna sp.]